MARFSTAAAGINALERMAAADSPVHRLHPMAKLITTIAYVAVVISFPPQNISGLIPFLFYPLIIMPLSGTPYRPLFARLLVALPFSVMGGVANLFFARGTALYIGGIAVSYGLISFVSIMLKTFLTVLAVLILIATTSMIDISRQMIALRIPKIFCLQLVMTYRYISVLIGEAAAMYTAYRLRAPKSKGVMFQDMGSFVGQLILRSMDRAERVYQSMKCRGFNGTYHMDAVPPRTPDWIYTISITLACACLRFFNLSVFLGKLAI